MKITSDWHIHSQNSCDNASMTMADLVAEASQHGIRNFGITDHIHTPFNLPDIGRSRAEFLSVGAGGHFHFGVEASSVSQWEIDEIAGGRHQNPVYGLRTGGKSGCALALGLQDADIGKYGIEYVVAGTHWPMYVPFERDAVIRDYHRQNMFLAAHPLVDIVAHPWWWMGHWRGSDGMYSTDPWFDDFRKVPASMHDEFASAAMEHDTKVEINLQAMLLNPQYPVKFKEQYLEYIAYLKGRGVKLNIGSDCHDAHYNTIDLETAAAMLTRAGIGEDDLWLFGQ